MQATADSQAASVQASQQSKAPSGLKRGFFTSRAKATTPAGASSQASTTPGENAASSRTAHSTTSAVPATEGQRAAFTGQIIEHTDTDQMMLTCTAQHQTGSGMTAAGKSMPAEAVNTPETAKGNFQIRVSKFKMARS